MRIKPAIAIIQARMSSTRLPGKVLLPLAGKPVIQHIFDRAKSCKNVGKVIVATSKNRSDNPLAEYCTENKIDVYRGSLNNVLSRFVDILTMNSYDYCVRITGDCPLIHPSFIDAQINALEKFNGDLLWSKKQSSVLEGQGVISKRAILTVNTNSNDPDDLEHVGSKYFFSNHRKFKYVELLVPKKYYLYDYRLTLDEKKDYEFLKFIYFQNWKNTIIELDEVLNWINGLNKSQIQNKYVQHSLINKQLNFRRKSFNPNIIGLFDWRSV